MRIYAQRPGRVVRQVLADVAALAWIVLVVQIARAVDAAVLTLQGPAGQLTGAGDAISRSFDAAARTASRVPFVGGDLAGALGSGTDAGGSLAASGRELTTAVAAAGSGVAVAIVLVGAVPIVVVWFVLRLRWVLAARAALRAGPDLLALHALTRRSPAQLARVSDDPAAGWRRGDPATVTALAAVELAALVLRGSRSGRSTRLSP